MSPKSSEFPNVDMVTYSIIFSYGIALPTNKPLVSLHKPAPNALLDDRSPPESE